MQEEIIIQQSLADPLLSEFVLPLRATYYPLGFPLELATNSQEVMEAASQRWGLFSQAFEEIPVRICLGVSQSDSDQLPPTSVYRSREHLMSMFADAENFAICDFNQGFAFGWTTRAVAANHPVLRYRFLNPVGFMLLEHRALAPLHCALIARNGCGVALFGESLAGKSTLAYACARAGWTFISDDGSHLVRSSSDRYAIGDPYTIRLREDAKQLFPELADRLTATRPNGKIGMEILTRDLPVAIAPGCSIDHVVFLNRNEPGPARILRYSKDEVLVSCERHVCFGTSEVRAAQVRCYRRLAGAGVWEMRYNDLDDAIVRLEQLVDSGG